MTSGSTRLFATAARGTEGALRDELRELRFRSVRADRGGVHFDGDLAEGARACLWSRIAVRILWRVGEFPAPDGQALYDGVRAIDWSPWVTPKHTLAVSAVRRDSGLVHTLFIAQRTKDGVVDQIRDRLGARPSVDLGDPDLRIFIHLVRDHATAWLDVSGESLHRRGWRARIVEAPLKETLAAACLRLSGWDRTRPLVDPMCGSGTLAIEAALWARGVAPGIQRARFGVERWPAHDAVLAARLRELRDDARARALPASSESPLVRAEDVDPRAIELTRANAAAAGVTLDLRVSPISALAPTDPPGIVVTNPPYGARVETSPALHREMAEAFARQQGHAIAILSGTPDLERAMSRTRPRLRKWYALWNGDIECRLLLYDVP